MPHERPSNERLPASQRKSVTHLKVFYPNCQTVLVRAYVEAEQTPELESSSASLVVVTGFPYPAAAPLLFPLQSAVILLHLPEKQDHNEDVDIDI